MPVCLRMKLQAVRWLGQLGRGSMRGGGAWSKQGTDRDVREKLLDVIMCCHTAAICVHINSLEVESECM